MRGKRPPIHRIFAHDSFNRTEQTMTLDQLVMFVAVAEREHLTEGAAACHRTPSAVSSAIKALEDAYRVRLFDRVGRGLKLTSDGRAFLAEARITVARVRHTELFLNELGGLARGTLDLCASQTIASYWLPPRLVAFGETYPRIGISLVVGNTDTAAEAVRQGTAELGFVEGRIDEAQLSTARLAEDRLVVVASPAHPLHRAGPLAAEHLLGATWTMREAGSGTRSEFESALARLDVDAAALRVVLTVPSNEALLSAVAAGGSVGATSRLAAEPFLANGRLVALDLALPPRTFSVAWRADRDLSAAAVKLLEYCVP